MVADFKLSAQLVGHESDVREPFVSRFLLRPS